MSDKKTSLFHDFPEELHITATICPVQEDPATIQLNTDAMDRQCVDKQERDKLVKREGFEKATDKFIKYLINRQMWDSGWCWKTSVEL